MRNLEANHVCSIRYDCRGRGWEDRGVVYGFWTGEIDPWGKRTIIQVGSGRRMYLFAEEIKAIRDVRS